MKFIGKIIFHVVVNAIAILAATYFVSGFIFNGDYLELAVTAIILTAINIFIKPVVKLFLGPFIILSFGLFTIIVNAVMLNILDIISPELTIQGMVPLLSATLIISLVNFILNIIGKIISPKT